VETKFQVDELKGFDISKLRQIEGDVRIAMAKVRMDVLGAATEKSKLRNHRRTVARVKTILREKVKLQKLRDQKQANA
jgi:ribosomal protein L29